MSSVPAYVVLDILSRRKHQRLLAGERKKKGDADRIAAVLILQGYLDRRGCE